MLNRLAPSVHDTMFGDSWPLMGGMRNRIAHGYLLGEPPIIRQTLATDIPAILAQIHRTLARD